ncbi:pentapeptide repeat-containing protein [Micromonospora sp. BQ11]|uniref:pentapeptide repeat-containing protein n=1 Tax=Micromonospora sp. BQ11 TaxID=3452212 RepID=UPI003F89DA5E
MQGTPPSDEQLRVMPWWLVLVGLLLAAALGWWVLDWLLGEADRAAQPDTRATLRIDAIRTGLTVVAGTGGGLALLLAARRQWISERAQRHQEAVAAHDQVHRERVQAHAESVAEAGQRHQEQQATAAEHDAAERRLTELYTRAVELLGNDNAAVRLGGLHALERLGQDNPAQRTTIVAVLCAYLRMTPPDDDARETEVRRTAQRVLTRHLRADGDGWWPGVALDLTGARLDGFDASGCTLVDADLTGAVCVGVTRLTGATVRGRLSLRATFDELLLDDLTGNGEVVLDGARTARTSLDGADLGGALSCRGATFGRVTFRGTTFHRPATFDAARVEDSATFRDAVFLGGLSMEHTVFGGYAGFRRARFADMALFRWTEFGGDTWFEGSRFEGAANFGRARFDGPVSFDGATFARTPLVDQARAVAGAPHVWPEGVSPQRLDDWLLLTDR